jgi:hypothetical protein
VIQLLSAGCAHATTRGSLGRRRVVRLPVPAHASRVDICRREIDLDLGGRRNHCDQAGPLMLNGAALRLWHLAAIVAVLVAAVVLALSTVYAPRALTRLQALIGSCSGGPGVPNN